jgi:hypothetical protein
MGFIKNSDGDADHVIERVFDSEDMDEMRTIIAQRPAAEAVEESPAPEAETEAPPAEEAD